METVSYPHKIGKYEILGLIGRGGMGMVYSGRDAVIDRIVAIKTIRIAHGEEDEDKQRERLRMEARSAGKLQHPNVVTIYDFGEEGELSYIVMELVEGANLSRVIQKAMPLSLATRIDLVSQLARGLAYAHDCGVVHRDLKPSNICITRRGVPKILDFGLARVDNTKLTRTGYLSGTVAYMSPERFGGDSGPPDDIFALGAVAYELFTGRRAFPGETTPEVIAKILSGAKPRPVSELTGYPQELDEVVFKAMARDPADRYATASDFENALAAFTRTASFRDFAAAEALLPQFSQRPDWSDETMPRGNPYSSSRSLESVVVEDARTLVVRSNEEPATEVSAAAPADRTLLTTRAANPADYATRPATPFIDPRRRRSAAIAIAAAALIIVAAGGAYLLRPDREPNVAVVPQTAAPQTSPAPAAAASRDAEVKLATATMLANLVTKRSLTAAERDLLAIATNNIELARQKIDAQDYEGGVALASDASNALQQLLSAQPAAPGPVPQPPPVMAEPKRAARAARKTQPVPAPVVAAAPVPQPQPQPVAPPPPQPETRPEPPVPTRADREREIRTFFAEMAAAYQQKDVAFFRERSLRFSNDMADAIRNSPSVRVEMAVGSIELDGDTLATVAIRRTDTFAESRVAPAVQNLVYELRRGPGGWRIASVARR